jgi:hypothetical protein
VLAADLNLAPLGQGDYILEVTVAASGKTERIKLAIRVKS